MGGLEELIRATGTAGWGLVALGFMLVVGTAMSGGRPRCGLLTMPAAVEGEPEKVAHSTVYTPPPYRKNYVTNRKRR